MLSSLGSPKALMTNARVVWVSALVAAGVLAAAAQSAQVRYERLFPLKSEEGVFAYARISPDGRTLAYASIMPDPERLAAAGLPRQPSRTTQTVVDLRTGSVQFAEAGIDAYWSLDGERMIFLAQSGAGGGVTIRHHPGGDIVRNVAPVSLGDYFSWAMRDGKNLILTIQSSYYYLDGDKAILPAGRVVACDRHRRRRPATHLEGRKAHHDLRPRLGRRARPHRLREHDRYGAPGRQGRLLVRRPVHRFSRRARRDEDLRDRHRRSRAQDRADAARPARIEPVPELDEGWPPVFPLRQ